MGRRKQRIPKKFQQAEEVMTKPQAHVEKPQAHDGLTAATKTQADVEKELVEESSQFCVDKKAFDSLASSQKVKCFTAGIGSVARSFASYNFSHLEGAMERLQSPWVYEQAMTDYARLLDSLATGNWKKGEYIDVYHRMGIRASYVRQWVQGDPPKPPKPEVHLIWISHMLRSEQYQSHCEEHLGGLVDHDLEAVVGFGLWGDFVRGHPTYRAREDGEKKFRSAVADLLPHSMLWKDTSFFAKLMQHFASLSLDVLANRSLYTSPSNDASKSCFKQLDQLLEQQYGGYLAFAITCSSVHVSPTICMDWLWHAHMLSPSKYRQSCQKVFGRVVHHRPKPKGFAATNIEDSWRSLFGEVSTDAIVRLTEPFIHALELEEQKRVQSAQEEELKRLRGEVVHRVEVMNMAGEPVTTLEIKAKTSQSAIKEMIKEAGGPKPKCQRLILPNATELEFWHTAGDISSSDCLTLVELESVASSSSESDGCMD